MPEKDTLNANEFAIQDAATFSFNPTGTSVIIKKDGSVVVTLNYTLDNPDTLQTTSGVIKLEGTCGVFIASVADHFQGSTETTGLSLSVPLNTSQVFIESSNGDITLLTDGVKGRQGNTVADDKKGKTDK